MISLWYEESYWGHTGGRLSGPEMVVKNLIKSLDLVGVPYAINEPTYQNNFFIQWNEKARIKHSKVNPETCLIGPQLWPFDKVGRFLVQDVASYKKIISPSQWNKDFYKTKWYLPDEKVGVWPVGIEIPHNIRNIQYDCLLYYKRRSAEELEIVEKFLKKKKLTYKILQYGNYTEEEFLALANQANFCFLLNGTESQGIAVQQIMSLGVPLFVWDVESWDDMGIQWSVPASSVPYWDKRCGEKFYKKTMLSRTFTKFDKKLKEGGYDPKSYVEENLSLERSAEILLELFK
tara:strand:- start:271 stop:1140 length:870 start_codon:yes stop_codon:yes gene_type:complete